jgi:hypothetical protein
MKVPLGFRSFRSHRASVPGSTPMRRADSHCDTPSDVLCRTNRPANVVAGGSGL